MITDPAEQERADARLAAARARHTATAAVAPFVKLDDETRPHPRGLRVACDGDVADGGTYPGCRAARGVGCSHPTRGQIPGYVHPTRLAAEAAYIARLSYSTDAV